MKKLFVQIHDRFSSSSPSFVTLPRNRSNEKITLEQTQTTSPKSQEHKSQKWRKRFSISTASLKKRYHEKNHNEHISQLPSTPYFFDQEKEEEHTAIMSSNSNNISGTIIPLQQQYQQQQRDINDELKTQQENDQYSDDDDEDFYNYYDSVAPRPFSCAAAVGRNKDEKGKREEKSFSIDDMSVPDIAKELRLSNSLDRNNNNDEGDPFTSFRNQDTAINTTTSNSPSSTFGSPAPISNNFILNNHKNSNDTSKNDVDNNKCDNNNNENQRNINHGSSRSIRSSTFRHEPHYGSQLASTRREEKNNCNSDETNKSAFKDAMLHLHARKSAAPQTENPGIIESGARKRPTAPKTNQEEQHVLQFNSSEQVDDQQQNDSNNFQHCYVSIIKKATMHDDVTMAKNENEANVYFNDCFSHASPTRKRQELNKWNSDKQQEQFVISTINNKSQDRYDSNSNKNVEMCNIASQNNNIVSDLSVGGEIAKNLLLSQQCTVAAQRTTMTKNCVVSTDNTTNSYATNDRKSNRTIDIASDNQGKQDTRNDTATIVKIQVEKIMMEMTLARKMNDVLNENASLKKRIKSMEEITNASSSSTTIGTTTNAMVPRAAKEKNKAVGGWQQQDKLLRTHALAQLGLIEYLEGEHDLASALERFKKQLETELSYSK